MKTRVPVRTITSFPACSNMDLHSVLYNCKVGMIYMLCFEVTLQYGRIIQIMSKLAVNWYCCVQFFIYMDIGILLLQGYTAFWIFVGLILLRLFVCSVEWISNWYSWTLSVLSNMHYIVQMGIKYPLQFQCVNLVIVNRAVLHEQAYSTLWVKLFCKMCRVL